MKNWKKFKYHMKTLTPKQISEAAAALSEYLNGKPVQRDSRFVWQDGVMYFVGSEQPPEEFAKALTYDMALKHEEPDS